MCRLRQLRCLLVAVCLWCAAPTFAAISDAGLLNDVTDQFLTKSSTWGAAITVFASYIFWTLVVISMVWTFGTLALRKADIGEFFAELIRFTVVTGFFWWLVSNGPAMAVAIINSLRKIGATAGGMPTALTPSTPVSIGFDIVKKSFTGLSWTHPIDNLAIVLVATAIVLCMAIVAANVLIALVTAWTLAYAGVFVLGFGGARWTSDIAIGYFRAMLAIGLELMTITLLVGIATSVVDGLYIKLDGSSVYELLLVLCVCAVLALLIGKIPGRVAALAGIGSGAGVTAGGVIGAAVGAAAAGAMAATVAAGVATQAAGAGNAILAAYRRSSGGTEGSGSPLLASGGGSGGVGGTGSLAGLMGGGGERGRSTGAPMSAGFSGEASELRGNSAKAPREGSESAPAGSTQGSGLGEGSPSARGAEGQATGGSTSAKSMTAGGIVLGMAGALASGVKGATANKLASTIDAAKARIGDTVGGRIAAEINNPGASARERRDNKDIARAQRLMAAQSRLEAARGARAHLLGGDAMPSFGSASLSGSNDKSVDAAAEIAAFRDRKTS